MSPYRSRLFGHFVSARRGTFESVGVGEGFWFCGQIRLCPSPRGNSVFRIIKLAENANSSVNGASPLINVPEL